MTALEAFIEKLDSLARDATTAFESATTAEQLEQARVEFLGARQGKLKAVQKGMGQLDRSERPAAGKKLNEVKRQIESAFQAAQAALGKEKAGPTVRSPFDPTLPGDRPRLGHVHPITQTIEVLKEIMGRLGFSVAEGPEIEDEWHNFEALNIPAAHPARDPLENFYIDAGQSQPAECSHETADRPEEGDPLSDFYRATAEAQADAPLLLRSQTSTVQIRVMEQTAPPIRIISLGRVYRPDTADATHYPLFHQMEGLLVDRRVTMADLKSVLRMFATSYLGEDVHIRFRPSFFPFTEPSVEADFWWNDEWVEFGGAGMVDPNVLQAVGYDPEAVSGFAFGLGVERLCMRRHQITDIREFYRNDVRFLRQF